MTTATVSSACRADMHPCCDLKDCGCPVCHHTCSSCGKPCRAVHGEAKVCAICYRKTMAPVSRLSLAALPKWTSKDTWHR